MEMTPWDLAIFLFSAYSYFEVWVVLVSKLSCGRGFLVNLFFSSYSFLMLEKRWRDVELGHH